MENPNDVPGFVASGGEDNRPRIKIKIKSVLDGSNTHTIFYVPNDSIVGEEPPRPSASSEALTTSTPLASPVVTPATPPPPEKPKPTSRPQSSLAASVSAPVISQNPPPTKPASSGGRGGARGGRRLSIGRPSRASLANLSAGSTGSSNNTSSTGGAAGGADSMRCDVCQGPGSASNVVQCDECHKNYHFGCLDPPVKKSPKRRGYSWHCADCDPTDTETN